MQFILDLIAKLLGWQPNPQSSEIVQPQASQDVIGPIGPVLTLNDWITSSGKYPERVTSLELNYDVKSAATVLVDKINALGRKLGLGKLPISSGFRPTSVNSNIKGAAKKSGHTYGKAVDFVDVDGKLKELVAKNPEILRELGLFMEDGVATPTWLHLDYISRADRPSRIFKP